MHENYRLGAILFKMHQLRSPFTKQKSKNKIISQKSSLKWKNMSFLIVLVSITVQIKESKNGEQAKKPNNKLVTVSSLYKKDTHSSSQMTSVVIVTR